VSLAGISGIISRGIRESSLHTLFTLAVVILKPIAENEMLRPNVSLKSAIGNVNDIITCEHGRGHPTVRHPSP